MPRREDPEISRIEFQQMSFWRNGQTGLWTSYRKLSRLGAYVGGWNENFHLEQIWALERLLCTSAQLHAACINMKRHMTRRVTRHICRTRTLRATPSDSAQSQNADGSEKCELRCPTVTRFSCVRLSEFKRL